MVQRKIEKYFAQVTKSSPQFYVFHNESVNSFPKLQKLVIQKYCNNSSLLPGGQTRCSVLKLQCQFKLLFVHFKSFFLVDSKSKKSKDPKWRTKGTHKRNTLNKKLNTLRKSFRKKIELVEHILVLFYRNIICQLHSL